MTEEAVAILVLTGASYLFACYVMYRIGKKFGIGSFGAYCVPIYNLVLMCRCGKIPEASVLGVLSPYILLLFTVEESILGLSTLVAMGFMVYIWGSVARQLGKSFWLFGIWSILPLINLIAFLVLAFEDSEPIGREGYRLEGGFADAQLEAWQEAPEDESVLYEAVIGPDDDDEIIYDAQVEEAPPTPQSRSLFFTKGEFSGETIMLPPEGMVIGRDPKRADLVLSSKQVSGAHVRIVPDKNARNRVVVSDLHSTNGTFFLNIAPGGRGWTSITEARTLDYGTIIRIADGVAEFEVR